MLETNSLSSINIFSKFFKENKEKFLAFAYSYLRDKEEAEDLFMESIITLWENRDRWQDNSNLNALLLTIIKNKALNLLTHQQVRLRAEEELNSFKKRELNLRISTLEACEPETIFNEEIQNIVNKALNLLPQQSKQIFILSRYQNKPNKAIAEQLGISVKSVEFHITKALKVIRVELKDYLISILL